MMNEKRKNKESMFVLSMGFGGQKKKKKSRENQEVSPAASLNFFSKKIMHF
jgi:hypothetical protein